MSANGWRTARREPASNLDLWTQLIHETKGRHITWRWVKGHSGNQMNERCDQLATAEAAFAAQTEGYRSSAGNLHSTVEGNPWMDATTSDAVNQFPTTPRHPAPITIETQSKEVLEKSGSFDEFRKNMPDLLYQPISAG